MALSTMSWASLRRQIVILAGVLLFAFAVAALVRPEQAVSGSDWTVLATQGEVKWRETAGQGNWRHLMRNARLPDGAEIRSGSDGGAVVAKGLDRIEIRADSILVVAARVTARGATEVEQSRGSATYTIEKRPAGTFSVRTPYVVAVVKGTQFSVDIGEEETNVSVDEGRVSVSDQRSRDSVDVTRGQTARASRSAAGIDVEKTPADKKARNAVPAPVPAPAATSVPNARPGSGPGVGSPAEVSSERKAVDDVEVGDIDRATDRVGGASADDSGADRSGAGRDAAGAGRDAAGAGRDAAGAGRDAAAGAGRDAAGAAGDAAGAAGDAAGAAGDAAGTAGDAAGAAGDAAGAAGDAAGAAAGLAD